MMPSTGARVVGAAIVCAALVSACQGGTTRASGTVPRPTTTVARATTTTTTPPVTYAVKQGDTLSAIAKRYGISVASVAAVNKITDPDKLTAGQIITIPPPPPPTTTTAPTTTTVPPPAKLVITPATAALGAVFDLELSGVRPSETVTFEVDGPGGSKFTGSPHTPTPAGKVSTVYVTTAGDRVGTYTVVATGTLGGSARGTFIITAATSG